MSQRSWLHPFLGIAGLAAWLLFILACTGWPSWSPDGRIYFVSNRSGSPRIWSLLPPALP